MRKLTPVLLLLLLAACAPRLSGVDPNRPPSPDTWDPQPAPVEWWYVSAYLPEDELAFHWAFFKYYVPERYRVLGLPARSVFPYPFASAHLAVTDLAADRFAFEEKHDFPGVSAVIEGHPLRLELEGWTFAETPGGFELNAGPLRLTLKPEKPAVVHPPGWSGDERVGRMYYVSYTRVALSGTIYGRPVQGVAWIDHQWGDQMSGATALWDWYGLHLSNGDDLMLYRIRDAAGNLVKLQGSKITKDGRVYPLLDLRMSPFLEWTSPRTGFTYNVAWRISGRGWSLDVRPKRLEQEIFSPDVPVAYWEGPVEGGGIWWGKPVTAWGMGEFVGGLAGWARQAK
ncbi:lipocalin-like domain-containing protein [Oceanithermus sp.]